MDTIITLTMNPCLDYTLRVREFGSMPESVEVQTGGKGLNVARVLSVLGVPAKAVCPAGGSNGQELVRLAKKEGIDLVPVPVSGETRRIDTFLRMRDLDQQVVKPSGNPLTETELDRVEQSVLTACEGAAALAVCGSAPDPAAAGRIPGIISKAKERGLKVLLDANGAALTEGIRACPDLVKPNEEELAALTGISGDPSRAAKVLLERGIPNVLVSLGAVGCVWINRESEIWCPAPRVPAVNAVGSGDSFVAGFLYATLSGWGPQSALRLACAAGAANAEVFPAARLTRERIGELLGYPF